MEIKTIGVIGAGTTGRDIAYLCALAGYRTILEAVSPELLERSLSHIQQSLENAVAARTLTGLQKQQMLANLSTARSVEDVCREADLLIEAAQEEMEVKLEIFTLFDKFAKPSAILASSSSAISISDLAEITFRAENCVGLRFRDATAQGALLELVRTVETSEDTVQACTAVGQRLNREVVVIRE